MCWLVEKERECVCDYVFVPEQGKFIRILVHSLTQAPRTASATSWPWMA